MTGVTTEALLLALGRTMALAHPSVQSYVDSDDPGGVIVDALVDFEEFARQVNLVLTQPNQFPVYSPGIACPDCAGTSWDVGRMTAECLGCGSALPLTGATASGGTFTTKGQPRV